MKAGTAQSITDAQFKIARLYGFPSWPKLKAHVDSLEEIGQLKQAIDTNDLARVKNLMTRNPELHQAPLGYRKDGPLTWVAECRVPWEPPNPAQIGHGEVDDRKRLGRAPGRGWAADESGAQRRPHRDDGASRILRRGCQCRVERIFSDHLRALRGNASAGAEMAAGSRSESELRATRNESTPEPRWITSSGPTRGHQSD